MLPVAPFTHCVRQYYPADIERALAASGMVAIERFGELDRRPLAPDSKRQVYVCQKA
jgi:hypothetical protein